MDLLSSIELPRWLMIGGAILIAMGFLGLAITRNKEVATDPDSGPPAKNHLRRNALIRCARASDLLRGLSVQPLRLCQRRSVAG
jgi:hypothetical protein